MIISQKVKEHHKLIFLLFSLFVPPGWMSAVNSILGKQRENADTHRNAWMLSMEHRKEKRYTPALHSKETVVKHKCRDVKCFLWPVSAISGDVCLCCCLFLAHQLFNLSNKWGADDQARQTPDGRFAYEDSTPFFFPASAYLQSAHLSTNHTSA